MATMMMAGEETSPALTAVSPRTSAPMTERASATYLGMRTLASTSTSSTASRKNISSPGERGIERMPPDMMMSSPKGISRRRNSCAATYSAGRQQGGEHRQQPQNAADRRAVGGYKVVLRALEVLRQHIGQRQRDGRAVREHGDAPLQHLRTQNVRLLRRARLLEQRVRPPRQNARDVRRVGHAVDVRRGEPRLDLLDPRLARNAAKVGDGDARLAVSSHRQRHKAQGGAS